MKRYLLKSYLIIFCFVLLITLNGCSFTQFVSSWGLDNNSSDSPKETTFVPIETTVSDMPEENPDYFLQMLDGEIPVEAKGSPKSEPEATKIIDGNEQLTGDGLTAKKDDNSVIRICRGGNLNMTNYQVISTSNSTDLFESRFYGVNSAVLCEPRSYASINSSEILCKNKGATGIFAYGNNAVVDVVNTSISTSESNSKGLSSSYKGSVFASNVNITTEGDQSPCVSVGRSGGTINAVSGTLSTAGPSSPIAYSCGELSMTGTKGTSELSECGVVEGKSSLKLTDCDLSAKGTNGFVLYQTNSGDTISGKTTLNIVSGKISNEKGATFYVTNTDAEIHIQFAEIENGGTLLSSVADKWGKSPENGGKALLFAECQKLSGDVYCDNKSTVDVRIMNGSVYEGAVNRENTGMDVKVTVDATSKWKLTDNCYVNTFTNDLETLTNIEDNGYNIYYDSTNGKNSWLNGRTLEMKDGGKILPA